MQSKKPWWLNGAWKIRCKINVFILISGLLSRKQQSHKKFSLFIRITCFWPWKVIAFFTYAKQKSDPLNSNKPTKKPVYAQSLSLEPIFVPRSFVQSNSVTNHLELVFHPLFSTLTRRYRTKKPKEVLLKCMINFFKKHSRRLKGVSFFSDKSIFIVRLLWTNDAILTGKYFKGKVCLQVHLLA